MSLHTAMDEGTDSHLDHLFSFHAAINTSGRWKKAFFPVHLPQECLVLSSVFSSHPSRLGSSGEKRGVVTALYYLVHSVY